MPPPIRNLPPRNEVSEQIKEAQDEIFLVSLHLDDMMEVRLEMKGLR